MAIGFDPLRMMKDLLLTMPGRWQRGWTESPRFSPSMWDGYGLCPSCDEFIHTTSAHTVCPICGQTISPSNPLRPLG
jgi:hypothetical protein